MAFLAASTWSSLSYGFMGSGYYIDIHEHVLILLLSFSVFLCLCIMAEEI
jgi:hypothetical protein